MHHDEVPQITAGDRTDDHGRKKSRAQQAAPRDPGVQAHGQQQCKNVHQHHRDRGVTDREPERRPEIRVAEHPNIVAQAHKVGCRVDAVPVAQGVKNPQPHRTNYKGKEQQHSRPCKQNVQRVLPQLFLQMFFLHVYLFFLEGGVCRAPALLHLAGTLWLRPC